MTEQDLHTSPAAEAEAQPHVLVVDDDKRIRELLGRYLGNQGFRVTTADNATEARSRLSSVTFDLLVLDIMMPGETGLQLTEYLRQESNVPILLLTAMGESEDRINGLSVGADDYLAKPFEPRELVLRIQAILKRARQAPETKTPPRLVKFGLFLFDLERKRLTRQGTAVYLTESESALLAQLAARLGQPVPREDLSDLGADIGGSRVI